MRYAVAVSDDERRSRIRVRFHKSAYSLRVASTERYGSHVHMPVVHGHQTEVLLVGSFAVRSKLRRRAQRCGFGRLAPGVGVDLGVEDQNVEVVTERQDVIETAVADIEGPAVAAEQPDALAHQVVGDRLETARFEGLDGPQHLAQRGYARALLGDSLLRRLVRRQQIVNEVVTEPGCERRQQRSGLPDLRIDRQAKAEPELRVVLEKGIRPRRTASVTVLRVGCGRQIATVDRGAAGGVGDEQAVAVELREELDVGRLAAAGACPGELEERLEELRSLDVQARKRGAVELGQVEEECEVRPLDRGVLRLRQHVDGLVLRVRLVLAGTDVHAQVAAGAVLGRHLDRVRHSLVVSPLIVNRLEGTWSTGEGFLAIHLGPDRRVRADERALVALDAELRIPDRDLQGDVAPLPLRGPGRPRAVGGERANRKEIALPGHHHGRDPLHEFGRLGRNDRRRLACRGRLRRQLDLMQILEREVDCGPVAAHHFVTFLCVALLDRLLDLGDRFLARQDSGEGEEAGLHDGVDAATHAGLDGHARAVDDVELHLLLDHLLLRVARQLVPDLAGRVR